MNSKPSWLQIFNCSRCSRGLVLGIQNHFALAISNQEENTKEKRNIEVRYKVDTITQKINGLDSLNQKINDINRNTIQVFAERERLLSDFNKMSEKIKSFNEYEKLKFIAEGPEIVPADLPNFTIFDSLNLHYFLNFPTKNIGNRTASKVDVSIIFFTNKNGVIYSADELESVSTPETIISPISKSNSWPTYRYIVKIRNSEKIENYNERIYLYVSIKYEDSITKKSNQFTDYYTWTRFLENGYKFAVCQSYENNLIKEYMKKHKIDF